MHFYKLFSALSLVMIITSCSSASKKTTDIIAQIQAKNGSKVSGTITVAQASEGVIITTAVEGLKPNNYHGFHIHEKGDCSAEDATSAGGHFSAHGHNHGGPDDAQKHEGDLGNLKADEYGQANTIIKVRDVTLAPNKKTSILGRAFIIHESKDDLKSQPSGNAGKRIACAVIE